MINLQLTPLDIISMVSFYIQAIKINSKTQVEGCMDTEMNPINRERVKHIKCSFGSSFKIFMKCYILFQKDSDT